LIPYKKIQNISKEEKRRNRYNIIINYHPKEENETQGLRTVYGSTVQIEYIPEVNDYYIILSQSFEQRA
jgi:hypothetical protein